MILKSILKLKFFEGSVGKRPLFKKTNKNNNNKVQTFQANPIHLMKQNNQILIGQSEDSRQNYQNFNEIMKNSVKITQLHQTYRLCRSFKQYYQQTIKMDEQKFKVSIYILLSSMNQNCVIIKDLEYLIPFINYILNKPLGNLELIILMQIMTKLRKLKEKGLKISDDINRYMYNMLQNISQKLYSKCIANQMTTIDCINLISLYHSTPIKAQVLQNLQNIIKTQKNFEISTKSLLYFLKGYQFYDWSTRRKYPNIINYIMHHKIDGVQVNNACEILRSAARLKFQYLQPSFKLPSFFSNLKKRILNVTKGFTHHQGGIILETYKYLPMNFDNRLLYKAINSVSKNQQHLQQIIRVLRYTSVNRLNRYLLQNLWANLKNKLNTISINVDILGQLCQTKNLQNYADKKLLQLIDKKLSGRIKNRVQIDEFQNMIKILKCLTKNYVNVCNYLKILSQIKVSGLDSVDLSSIIQYLLILEISHQRDGYQFNKQYMQQLKLYIRKRISQPKKNIKKFITNCIQICNNTKNAEFQSIVNIHKFILQQIKISQQSILKIQPNQKFQLIISIGQVKHPADLKQYAIQYLKNLNDYFFSLFIEYYVFLQQKSYVLADLLLATYKNRTTISLSFLLKIIAFSGKNNLMNDRGSCNGNLLQIVTSDNFFLISQQKLKYLNPILISKAVIKLIELKINMEVIKKLVWNFLKCIISKKIVLNCQQFLSILQTFHELEWNQIDKFELSTMRKDLYKLLVDFKYDQLMNSTLIKLLYQFAHIGKSIDKLDQIYCNELLRLIFKNVQQYESSQNIELMLKLIELDQKKLIKLDHMKKKQYLLKIDNQENVNILWTINLIKYIKKIDKNSQAYNNIRTFIIPTIQKIYLKSQQFIVNTVLLEYLQISILYKNSPIKQKTLNQLNMNRLKPLELIAFVTVISKSRIDDQITYDIILNNYRNYDKSFFYNHQIQIMFYFSKSFYLLPTQYLKFIDQLIESVQTRVLIKAEKQNFTIPEQYQYSLGKFINFLWVMLLHNKTEIKIFKICLQLFIKVIPNKLQNMHSQYLRGMICDIYVLLISKKLILDKSFFDKMNSLKNIWMRQNPAALSESTQKFLKQNNFIYKYGIDGFVIDFYNKQLKIAIITLHSYLINIKGTQQTGYSKMRDIILQNILDPQTKIIKINLIRNKNLPAQISQMILQQNKKNNIQ